MRWMRLLTREFHVDIYSAFGQGTTKSLINSNTITTIYSYMLKGRIYHCWMSWLRSSWRAGQGDIIRGKSKRVLWSKRLPHILSSSLVIVHLGSESFKSKRRLFKIPHPRCFCRLPMRNHIFSHCSKLRAAVNYNGFSTDSANH